MKISKKSLWMIVTSFLVSAALIITVTLYAVNVNKQGPMQSEEMWFVIGMVLVAAVTFGLFAWFRLHRGRYVKKLNSEYFAEYEKLGDALQSSKMSKAEVKEIKLDLLTLLLEAQNNGRKVSEVTGGDIQGFAQKIQSSFGYRNSFWFELCSIIQYGIFFVVFIHTLLYFSTLCAVPYFEGEIGFSLAVMFLPIIFIIYPVLKRAMRKDKSTVAMMIPLIYGVGFILLTILLDNFFGKAAWVRFFLDTQIIMISSLWQLIVMTGVFVLAQAAKWYMRRQSVKKLD